MTNLCSETTARSAFVRDFDVIFLSDGNATLTPEMHEATLLNLVSIVRDAPTPSHLW